MVLPLPPTPLRSLSAGAPRFADAAIARIAQQRGDVAAWHALWQRDGLRAAAGVGGEFALALQEPSGRSFLAVDRFAIRSLCYRVTGSGLRFALRADELADADDAATVQSSIDPQALFDYLYFHAIPSPRTIFKGVFRLPPGHCALFENGRLTVRPYWIAAFEPRRGASFDKLRGEFLGGLRESVAGLLGAGGKPACFLSGGTDSSTIAGLIGEAGGARAATYSIGFDAAGYDEMAFARLAAKHFRTEHHEYYVTPDDLVDSIARVATHYDQPFGNSSALPAFCCARMAKQDGVDLLLAGDGGDELFGGNTRYARQKVFGWYGAVPAGLRSGLVEPLLLQGRAARRLPPGLRKAASYVEQARVAMPERLHSYNLLLRLGVAEVLHPEYLARIDTDETAREQQVVWDGTLADNLVDRMLAFDWRYTLAENDLPKVRGTAELAGVRVGFPFLDDRLLALSLALPAGHKLKRLKLRWFFKQALRGFLPDEILAKRKQGFGLPFGVWLTRHAGLRSLATDSLRSLAKRRIVRADFIESLLGGRLAEHPAYYGEMVWILMMLEQWLQGRERRPPQPASPPRFSAVATP